MISSSVVETFVIDCAAVVRSKTGSNRTESRWRIAFSRDRIGVVVVERREARRTSGVKVGKFMG